MNRVIFAGAFAVLAASSGSLFAQVPGVQLLPPVNVAGPYSAFFPPGQTGMAVQAVRTAASGGGLTAEASGFASVARGGTITKIPLSIATKISTGAAVAAAGRAVAIARALSGPVGVAFTAWQIYNAYKDAGVHTCPPPDFFCTPGPDTDVPGTAGGFTMGSPFTGVQIRANNMGSVCAQVDATMPANMRSYYGSVSSGISNDPNTGYCFYAKTGNAYYSSKTLLVCPAGTVKTGDACIKKGDDVPSTPDQLDTAISAKANADATGQVAQTLWDGAVDASAKAESVGQPPIPRDMMMPPNAPTVVTAPPVALPPAVVSTQNFTDTNGVPQVKTVTSSDTITPQVSGTSTNTNITYDIKNITTTTVTNNTSTTTNNPPSVTIDTTQTRTDPPPVPTPTLPKPSLPTPLPADFPKDYNKEVTQQKIAADIEAMRKECELNPKRAACSELDAPPVADLIPKLSVPVNFTPVIFASSASCPAPINFYAYGARVISFVPMCDLMTTLRPLFLACAAAAAALIFMQGLKT